MLMDVKRTRGCHRVFIVCHKVAIRLSLVGLLLSYDRVVGWM